MEQQHVEQSWPRVRERLRREAGETIFGRCLAPLHLLGAEGTRVIHGMDNPVMREWVNEHYAARLRRCWQMELPWVSAVEVVTAPGIRAANGAAASAPGAVEVPRGEPAPQSDVGGGRSGGTGRGSTLPPRRGPGLNPEFTFDTFVVGPANRLAVEAARRAAQAERPHFNPLYVHGPTGVGKTHLLHAIGNATLAERPETRVRYASAEDFLYRFVAALRGQNTLAFKEEFRSVDVLLVDDVQFIARKEVTQEEFFHTLNALVTEGRLVVISADCAPGELEGFHERVRSRLGGGMTAEIGETDYALRLGILQRKAERFQAQLALQGRPPVEFEPGALALIAERVVSNGRVLEGLLNKVAALADLLGKPVDAAFAQSVLRDTLTARERTPSIDEIIQVTADHKGFKPQDLKSERRTQALVRARHMAMWLCRELTERSYPQIAQRFGDRDHSTCIHAVRRIDDLIKREPALAAELKMLIDRLKQGRS